jgi:hypothetical protein
MFNPVYDKMKSKPEEFYGDAAYDTYELGDRLERDGVQATYL